MAWVAVLVGAGTPALIVLAGPLALIDERLIEVPLVLIGCAWVWLGGTMLGSANAGSVSVFTIGVGNVGGTLLQDLAAGTGGQYLAAPDAAQIAQAYQRIANMLRNEYLLTFTSPITDCSSHTVEVRVTGQTPGTSTFTRCDAPTGGGGSGGGGGGGGGGGALGLFEIFAGLTLVALAHRGLRRRVRA